MNRVWGVRRLLAAAGLPYRLIRALDAATAELRSLPAQVAPAAILLLHASLP